MKKNIIIFHLSKDKILTSKEIKVKSKMVIFEFLKKNLLHNKYQKERREMGNICMTFITYKEILIKI